MSVLSRIPLQSIPKTVWILGFVSLLMDVSSEMVQTLLPLYLVSGLGVSALAIGMIEAIAVATATVTKLFAGVLSDMLASRKWLAVVGYGLGALSRPIFPLADGVGHIVTAKFIDRIGKGIRSAPRDALIADAAPPDARGASFGLRKSLDTMGGFIGPLIAVGVMLFSGADFTLVFWLAVLPAAAAIGLLIFGIREPQKPYVAKSRPAILRQAAKLNRACWMVMIVAAILMLARFSEAFLLLRAEQSGIAVSLVPLVMVLMHAIYGLCAYPMGVLSDRIGRGGLLAGSIGVLATADLAIAFLPGKGGYLLGIILWGMHMGMSQGLLATLIADHAPAELRGSAFGMFNLICGGALLIGNVLAGVLWEFTGSDMTFLAGAGFCVLAGVAIQMLPLGGVITGRKRD
ncbi:MFS transporter [Thalassospira xianhensis]|uniref:MFS transporter n=1 Tax=Thalassospira xianhensis MCCC 1A02616 TaxID=1177929 RepID=A0A367UEU0_9PROT|nr:MFS transporter [Thalassospira xianhensis]RCK06679.1 MFS transporter [Thalassospira xianhensis MCCC 1A02616]